MDMSIFQPLTLDATQTELNQQQLSQLKTNIQFCRDLIVFFTAIADAKGLGGHTGGPYDIVPEVLIADALMKGNNNVLPFYFDEAGHRVAIQYLMSVLNGHMPAEKLLHYREFDSKLPGHPERDFTPGVKFSSGRLGHMWPYVNGVAMANPDKTVFMFGSDGSQMEGDDAEAARLAVAQNLNIKLVIDDNDVTIADHPSKYMKGYSVSQTLAGHGLTICQGDGEDVAALYTRMAKSLTQQGPIALINDRKMAVGIKGLEGSCHGHDVIKVATAIEYLTARGHTQAVTYLNGVTKESHSYDYQGSEGAGKNRDLFGSIVVDILSKLSPEQRKDKVHVYDCDLEGSCGLHHIHKAYPEIYTSAGIMERGNYSAAAGFGMEEGRQGIFGTFAAFQEMCISEITMARLNESNVIAHFSHSGIDDMADNTCHFGINNFFADNGIEENDHTKLYFPADALQMDACLRKIFWDKGLRFIYSTRSAVPNILKEDGSPFFGQGYQFTPGKDDIIRQGTAGYIVSFGEMLYRALDAVQRLRAEGIDVGLINKTTLNVEDDHAITIAGKSPFVLVAESQNQRTGLGARYGSWLLKRGLAPKYAHYGVTKLGNGGLWQHMGHQGLDAQDLYVKIKKLLA